MKLAGRGRLASAVVATIGLVTSTTGIAADEPAPGRPFDPRANRPAQVTIARIQSDPTGVTIFIQAVDYQPGSSRPASVAAPAQPNASARQPVCTATPVNIGNASVSWARSGAAANPGRIPYAVVCDGVVEGIVWLPTSIDPSTVRVSVDPGGAVDPRAVAESLLSRLPLPEITVGVNPSAGLVALPSWFWVEGYDGAPIAAAATLGGMTVEVELTAERFHWRFGDGAELTTGSLGRSYPEPSDLRHTYEQSSLRAGGAYDVQVAVTFRVRFRVSGGGGSGELAPITRTYCGAYPVRQAQAVLTGP